jgi:hypothetical protein
VRLELLTVALAATIAGAAPLSAPDAALQGAILRLRAVDSPSRRVVAVLASAPVLARASCPADVARILATGRARGALSVIPADALCPAPSGAGLGHPSPWLAVPRGAVRLDPIGHVTGFARGRGAGTRALDRLGLRPGTWVRPASPRAVPRVALADLLDGRVSPRVLRGRVVVLGMRDGGGSGTAHTVEIAAAVDGGLRGAVRSPIPGWAAALLAAALVLGIALVYRRARGRWAVLATVVALGAVAGLALALPPLLRVALLPVASLALAVLVATALLVAPRFVASIRGVAHAAELVERAALFRMQGTHTIPEPEFWARVAALAEQVHPADLVLIAELPPHRWHLRFWPYRQSGENVVAERRRDVRRTPYSSEQGVPTTRLVRGFLVVKDMPTVVVPLIAFGDIEGCLFLCGATAEATFLAAPERAERLAENLALMLRRRRLSGLQEDDWRRTAGMLLARPEQRSGALIDGARVAVDDLRMFATLLREAPVGLLYADCFGDVRVIGEAFERWLAAFGLPAPRLADQGPLAPGALPLARVLGALLGGNAGASRMLASGLDQDGAVRIRIETPEDKGRVQLWLSLRAVRRQGDGSPWIAAWVASLVESDATAQGATVVALPGALGTGAIDSVPAVDLVAGAVAAASRRAGRTVRFEAPRGAPYVLAHRASLARALENLLVDAASRGGAAAPVVSLEEKRRSVEIRVLDLGFGLPESVVRRALAAPGEPPEGLEALGRLASAVQECHGEVVAHGESGWGMTLVLRLVRARPLLLSDAVERAEVIDLFPRGKKPG